MKILHMVVNGGLVESQCNISLCFPKAVTSLFIRHFCLIAVTFAFLNCGTVLTPLCSTGHLLLWLRGHPAVCTLLNFF